MALSQRLLLAAGLLVAPPLRAQSTAPSPTTLDQTIETEHRRGMQLRAQHQDEQARTVFENLWNRTHEPRARARQALAEHAMGLEAECETHLLEALSFRDDAWIAQNRTLLEPIVQQSRAAQGIALLTVQCPTTGASVYIGETLTGPVGAPMRLPPGRVHFSVRAQGYATQSRVVELTAGAAHTEELTLLQSPTTASTTNAIQQQNSTPSGQSTTPASASATTAPITRMVNLSPPPAPASSAMRAAAWGTAAGAVAFVATGAIAWGVGAGAASRWNNDSCLANGRTREQNCANDLSLAENMRVVSIGGWIGGGVLAVSSTLLFVLSRPSAEERRSVQIRCVPSVGSSSLVCAGVF